MRKLAFLLLLAVPAVAQITDYEACQQKACYGFRPPTGGAQNGMIYQDLSSNPPKLYCGTNGTWALCGSSAGGTINSIAQFYLAIQPNTGSGSVLGQPTTAMNGLVPMLNGIRNVQLYCNTPGTLDDSCLSNALLANTTLNVPAGTYNLNNVVNVTQSGITFQCAPGATLVQNNATQGFNVTGNNVTFDGCTLNTNNQPNQVIEANGVSNVTFKNGTVNNATATASYAIRIDHGAGVNLVNNTCNTPTSNCLQMFDSSTILVSGNHGTGHIGIASSSGAPSPGNSITVTGNNMSPSKGAFAIEIGDFSGGNNPIDSLTVNGNNCSITAATTAPNAVHGCYSIVGHVSKCSVTNNTVKSINQFVSGPVFELGVDSCSITGNSVYAPDTNNQGYASLESYGGQNTISGNTITGWGQAANTGGIVIYPQTPGGTSHISDGNDISGNTVIGVNQSSSFGIVVQCNNLNSSALNTKIMGNLITTSVGTLTRAISMEDDAAGPPDKCPVSASIDNNTIVNAGTGIIAAAINPLAIGKNDFINVTTNYTPLGATVLASATVNSPIITPSITPTNLSASVQGLCYPTANQPITNVGCAAINAGQVTFTPTAVGWYRIINGGSVAIDRGYFDAYAYYTGANFPSTRVTFSLQTFGANAVKVDNLGNYGGTYGAIDAVRASSNGSGQTYLDIHIGTIAGVTPITIAYYGQAIPAADIVANPVVGAVAGASNVITEDYTTFSTNGALQPVSTAESGQHYADTFNATGLSGGFLYHGAAPNGHVLMGNGNVYIDGTIPTQILSANLTTTAAASDIVTVTGVSASSTCSFSAGNAAAATNIATAYISLYAANAVTLTHAAVANMTYSFICKP